MKILDVRQSAAEAVSANASRPATRILHDSPDARLIVFRIAPGQAVSPHRNASTVTLTVISGRGFVLGGDEERAVTPGETVVFEPNALHGMRAESKELVLLATITPRPGNRLADAPAAVALGRATGDERQRRGTVMDWFVKAFLKGESDLARHRIVVAAGGLLSGA